MTLLLLLATACTPTATDSGPGGAKSDDADGDGFTSSIDCDDDDAAVGIAGTWYADSDGDTFGNPSISVEECDPGAGFVADGTDCDDADAASHPGGAEVCDEADNDCDGGIDEDASNAPTWYLDLDGDLYGDAAETACSAPAGYVQDGGDCDDADAAINPGATEVCDGSDNNCDGDTDENDAAGAPNWYEDGDGDGFGAGEGVAACVVPSGYADNADDCDDDNAGAYPGAVERCDDVDEDCDSLIDNDPIDPSTWFVDGDADGFGDAPTVACDLPLGASAVDGDCDDTLDNVYPGAVEHCDDLDEDCDGDVDEDVADPTGWYADVDGDGYGSGTATYTCDGPPDTVDNGDDCNDADSAISPSGVEVCDDVDQDCDGTADDAAVDMGTWYDDIDGDGWGGATFTTACDQPANTAASGGDCDDTDPSLTPGATEHCDGLDEDCDGVADDSAVDRTSFYYDADGDGYGDPAVTTLLCDASDGFVDNNDDCDDADITVYDTCPASCGTLVSYPGNVDFNGFGAASDMATFCSSYNAIGGDLVIENTDVADLVDLSCLCEVEGDVTVQDNSTFVTFEGAAALRYIGGGLLVDDNDMLVDLTGLSGLEQVGETLDLRTTNAVLAAYGDLEALVQIGSLSARFESFEGLNSLTTIDNTLTVSKATAFSLAGLESLQTVGGAVSISNEGVTSLAPLSSLTTVGGFSLNEADGVATLDGLASLTTIENLFSISNGVLTSLDGLDSLSTLGGLNLSYTEELTDLSALTNVTALPDGLTLTGAAGLADLSAFSNVTTLGALSINSSDALYDLHGLDAVTSITGLVGLSYNDGLNNLGGLDQVASIDGSLTVRSNPLVTSLDGLGSVLTIGNGVTISTNGVDTFVGLDSIQSIGGSMTIGGASAPDAAAGLETLQEIGGTLTMEKGDTTGLENVTSLGALHSYSNGSDLSGLTGLIEVTGDLEAYYLPFASGFDALTTVGGNFSFQVCTDSATTIGAFSKLETVGGAMGIYSCSTVTSFTGWTGLNTVGGDFTLSSLNKLASLPDWSAITEVGGLYIASNGSLANLDAFSGLTLVDGPLQIYSNNTLDSVLGLHGITAVNGTFTMQANGQITTAEAEALRDAIGTANITGTITISE